MSMKAMRFAILALLLALALAVAPAGAADKPKDFPSKPITTWWDSGPAAPATWGCGSWRSP
jgi:ABC-type glycerol-3-phosphate transport system substrate-binding protein